MRSLGWRNPDGRDNTAPAINYVNGEWRPCVNLLGPDIRNFSTSCLANSPPSPKNLSPMEIPPIPNDPIPVVEESKAGPEGMTIE